MWQCTKCHETSDDTFGACWNCGTSKEGVEDPSFGEETSFPADAPLPNLSEIADLSDDVRDTDPIVCSRCYLHLKYVGLTRLEPVGQSGSPDGSGHFIRAIDNTFEMYLCPRCGRAELFAEGIGTRFRSD
jgi:hypothetical protein